MRILVMASTEAINKARQLLNSEDDVEVIESATNLEEGVQKALILQPHIILVQLYLPRYHADDQFKLPSGMSIIEAVHRIETPSIMHFLKPHIENTSNAIHKLSQQSESSKIVIMLPHSLLSDELELLKAAGVKYAITLPLERDDVISLLRLLQ